MTGNWYKQVILVIDIQLTLGTYLQEDSRGREKEFKPFKML